jgi:hypothetical protein
VLNRQPFSQAVLREKQGQISAPGDFQLSWIFFFSLLLNRADLRVLFRLLDGGLVAEGDLVGMLQGVELLVGDPDLAFVESVYLKQRDGKINGANRGN